jgi:hypothetical protein
LRKGSNPCQRAGKKRQRCGIRPRCYKKSGFRQDNKNLLI